MTDKTMNDIIEKQRHDEQCNMCNNNCKNFSPATQDDVTEYNVPSLTYFKCWRTNKPCANYYECFDR